MYGDSKPTNPKVLLAEAIYHSRRDPLAFEPGSRWHYSVGIDVAARVIEAVSGHALGDFLRERLLEPLGMIDTAFEVPEGKRDRLAAMYRRPDLVAPGQTLKSCSHNGSAASTSGST
jgi:CubicO group peptidase (beta-lactamase class C family)